MSDDEMEAMLRALPPEAFAEEVRNAICDMFGGRQNDIIDRLRRELVEEPLVCGECGAESPGHRSGCYWRAMTE